MSSMPPPIAPHARLSAPCAAHGSRWRIEAARRARTASLAVCCALATFGFTATAGAQQVATGQIYIPGPGERIALPQGSAGFPSGAASGSATGAASGAPSATAATSGMITIPGPGEHTAQGGAQPAAGVALPRETVSEAAQRVVPVVVTSAPRAMRPAQPIVVDRPASTSAAFAINIDPLTARGEPPRFGVSANAQGSVRAGAQANASPQAAQLAPLAAPSSSSPFTRVAASAPTAPAQAPAAPAGEQDGESIRSAAQVFLQQQTIGLPGKITITVAPAFARGLAACTSLVPFMPPGARVWGQTTVGVRCAGERPWTIYLQARVSLDAPYYLAAREIEPGVVITAADVTTRQGDLANLPRTIVTDASQAVGAVALVRISSGSPLRQDMLRSASSVTMGQTVRVVAAGPGFTISSEGSVMNNAAPGQQVRVKTPGGQIISGIVKDGSTVEIQM